MAPIVTTRSNTDSNDNNTESNNRPSARASTVSRESSGTGVKTKVLTTEKKEPAGPERTTKPSSASSSTSSSRVLKAVLSKSSRENQTKPTPARKDVKTPPSSAGAPANTEEKAVKVHPMPSAQLTKHKQAAVFTSGKKKHKRWV